MEVRHPVATVDRIVATATAPLTESGQLASAALDTALDAARSAEETYLAALAEAAGVGSISGFGGQAARRPGGQAARRPGELDDVATGIHRWPLRAATPPVGAWTVSPGLVRALAAQSRVGRHGQFRRAAQTARTAEETYTPCGTARLLQRRAALGPRPPRVPGETPQWRP